MVTGGSGANMGTRQIAMPEQRVGTSPLAGTLAAIAPITPYNRVAIDPTSALPTLADLCAGDGAGLNEQLEILKAYHETEDGDIAVALGAMVFPWLVASVAFASYLSARRIPDLSPAMISYTFADYGYPLDIILRSPRFTALPDDPTAGHPDATIVADEVALLAVLRRELGEHIEAPLRVMRARRARVGMGTIRRTAREACLSALCSAAAKLDGLAQLPADVEAIFRMGSAENPLLLRSLPVIREYPTGRGGRAASVELSTCCLRFRLPGRGTCPGCPNQPPGERARRLAEAAMLYG